MLANLEELSTSLKQINLKETFPQSFRLILRKIFLWYMIYLAFTIRILLRIPAVGPESAGYSFNNFTYLLCIGVIVVGGIICLLKLIYEIVYRSSYHYSIEDSNLVITEGVFLKQRGLFPITSIRDVYLDRKFLDLIFGLYNLHVSNANIESHTYGDVKGLSPEAAVGFQDYLKKLTVVVNPENKKVEQIDPEEFKISEDKN